MILIVDDDPLTRRILAHLLDEAGFQIVEVSNGVEALASLRQHRAIQLILVDWRMPRMNGYQLISAIRASPAYAHIKLMMVTARNSIEDVTKALAIGADEYLMKPITRDALLEKLQLLGVFPTPYDHKQDSYPAG